MSDAPSLPRRPREPYQFGLASILFCALGCMVGAGLAREFWTSPVVPAWLRIGMAGFGGSLIAYLTLRLPYVTRHLRQRSKRWEAIQAHRKDLSAWADKRRNQHARQAEAKAEGGAADESP